jgi:hypothetical protein
MVRLLYLSGVFVFATVLSAGSTFAQTPPGSDEEAAAKQAEQEAAALAAIMSDKRLLALHREFISRAERLALEYENDEDFDKAKAVWGEILKLAPQYEVARAKMQMLLEREANAEVVRMTVRADEAWQDTGIIVVPGKPVRIRAAGYWTFGLRLRLTPDGIRIPEELREFNLGSLIGVIDSGDPQEMKPFVVGNEKSFEAERPGRLMLRMYDISPEDNEGALQVEIRGSFERGE